MLITVEITVFINKLKAFYQCPFLTKISFLFFVSSSSSVLSLAEYEMGKIFQYKHSSQI